MKQQRPNKDSARLNWIQARGFDLLSFTNNEWRVQDANDARMYLFPQKKGLRNAIDAAMKEELSVSGERP